jgi:hypothetical protein
MIYCLLEHIPYIIKKIRYEIFEPQKPCGVLKQCTFVDYTQRAL